METYMSIFIFNYIEINLYSLASYVFYILSKYWISASSFYLWMHIRGDESLPSFFLNKVFTSIFLVGLFLKILETLLQ